MISNLYDETILYKSKTVYSFDASDRNHIAVQHEKGIEIVTLDCSASSKSLFFRYVIITPENFPIAKHLSSERNEFLWSLDAKSVTEMSMDPYAARIVCSAGNPTIERFKFSPVYQNTTYLAILTTFMTLTVYKDDAGKWTQVFDVTEERLKLCTPNWTEPTTSTEWYQLLNQVKINAFCWQIFNEQLFLITAFENGDFAIFDSSFKLIQTFPTVNPSPIDVHSVQMDSEIFLAVSYRTGQISGFVFDPEDTQILKKTDVWVEKDLLEPYPIYALKLGSEYYVVGAKSDEILVVALKSPTTVDLKIFDNLITSLSIGGGFIYATLANGDVFKILPSSLKDVTQIHAGHGYCPGGVCTMNGYVFVMAAVTNAAECCMNLLVEPQFDAKLKISRFLRGGGKVIDGLDLLWLHKRNIIENAWGQKFFQAYFVPELQYWELTLSLALLPQSDEQSQKRIMQTLEELGNSLLSQKNCILTNDECPICGQEINTNSLTVATCKNGHSVPRCCISLKPCSALDEATCVLCQSKISLKHVENYQNATCSFCTGYFKKTIPTLT